MSEWHWFERFDEDAAQRGDTERLRLRQLHRQGYAVRETDPDHTLALFSEGRQLAEHLGEPWWFLLFEQWQVHGRIYYKRDFRNLVDDAVKNVLQLRKPVYAGYPQRLWVHHDLITVYLSTDPLGHADAISEAIDYIEAELTTHTTESRYLMMESRIQLALEQKQLDAALTLTLRSQANADADPERYVAQHFLVAITAYLCLIGYRRGDWTNLGGWAAAAEEAARQMGYQYPLARALMWQALAARKEGDRARSRRLHRTATSRKGRLRWPTCGGFYDALCAYHELEGHSDEALNVRDQQLQAVLNTGQIGYECEIRVKRCRLLAQMGRLSDSDLADAQASAQKLRRPQRYVSELERIASGDLSPEAG
jgi:hypothetical protein